MKRFLVLFLSLFLVLLVAGCDNVAVDNSSKPNNQTNDQNNQTPVPPPGQTVYSIGELIEFTNGLSIIVMSTKSDMGKEYFGPDEGNEYFYVMVQLTNNTGESQSISSLLQFKLKNDDGLEYSLAIFADTTGSLDGSIISGDKMTGEVAFEIPKDSDEALYLYFSPSLFSDPVKIKVR